MSQILNGKELSQKLASNLKEQISHFRRAPKLLIIQVGNRKESNTYIKRKKEFAHSIGSGFVHKKYNISITEKELVKKIITANLDKTVDGIIVQLPLPRHIDPYKIVDSIDPKKDVDGQTPSSLKALLDNRPGFIPATTRGIITLLEYNNVPIKGKKVTVIGRSTLVGKPTALALLNKGATVTICHRDTLNLKHEAKKADILIVAVGKPNFISKEYVKRGQVVIDVGINHIGKNGNSKIVGDVNFNKVQDIVKKISPVPGGVGPMTILSLFENLLIARD